MSLLNCATCGIELKGSVWCDSKRELMYGGGQCRECYAKEHPICKYCGEFLYIHYLYCPYCGKSVREENETQK
jgi:hypothetical protein